MGLFEIHHIGPGTMKGVAGTTGILMGQRAVHRGGKEGSTMG